VIGLPATVRVFVAVPPADLRKGNEGSSLLDTWFSGQIDPHGCQDSQNGLIQTGLTDE
jgi:hypothetical protein